MDYKLENIYELLQKSDWDKLLSIESKHRTDIIKDPMIKQIFDVYFIDAVINYVKNEKDKLSCSLVLKKIYNRFIHHRNKTYSIPDKKFEELVIHYLSTLQMVGSSDIAYNIAQKWKDIEEANKFVVLYENTHSKELIHSNNDTIKVSVNPNIQKENHTISLFKSNQEYEFYYAIRESYPNYLTYPNVAVSCIIDFDKIKDNLNKNEKEYFFKAIVDCVVYEELNTDFIPKFYFELDSIYHDEEKQKVKDSIKDKFFSLAGQELMRIRGKYNISLKRNDFKKMIKEVLN